MPVATRMRMAAAGATVGGAFSPSDLTNLYAWLDAALGTYQENTPITPSGNGDPVGYWADQSGNGKHVVQATPTAKPTLNTTGGPSSLPVLTFDGGDNLAVTFGATLTQPTTLFAVFNITNWAGTQVAVDGIGVSNRHAIFVTTGGSLGRSLAGVGLANANTWPNSAAFHDFASLANGASGANWQNGSKTTGNLGTNTLTGLIVGSAYNSANYLTGNIAEIILYSDGKNDTDVGQVLTYLVDKYGHR